MQRLARILLPLGALALLLALLSHRSQYPVYLGRYSADYALLLLCTALATLGLGYLSLSAQRFARSLRSVLNGATVSAAVIVASLLSLLEIGFDLKAYYPLVVVIPLLLAWRRPRGRLGAALPRSAMVLGSLLLSLVLLEGAIRGVLAEPKRLADDAAFDRIIRSQWPRPITDEKPAGTFRVLGLADSFGLAGAHHNYHYLLERHARDAGLKLEVVNLSVAAYELTDELALLRRFAARFTPDLVLHGFFVGNDFTVPEGSFVSFRNVPLRAHGGVAALRPHHFLASQWLARTFRSLGATRRRADESEGTFSEAEFLRIERERLAVCRRGAERGWARIEALLDGIRTHSESLGARYAMVVHPDQFQVEQPLRQALSPVDWERHDLEAPQRFLTGYCERHGLACVDLLPAMRERGAGGGLYLPRDTHYNAAGNQLAAARIFGHLRDVLSK